MQLSSKHMLRNGAHLDGTGLSLVCNLLRFLGNTLQYGCTNKHYFMLN